jgi:enoyl-CoA hydratase/carnithine racemase
MIPTVLNSLDDDGVRTITLHRPERLNAINGTLLGELLRALEAANRDAATRAIVLRGSGRAFCAGDDLKEFDDQRRSPADTQAYIEQIQEVTRALVLGEKIVVGAIHGWAVGGGFEWMINCVDALRRAHRCQDRAGDGSRLEGRPRGRALRRGRRNRATHCGPPSNAGE